MAGLVPAIHAAPLAANPKLFRQLGDVDDLDKPGHDGVGCGPSLYPVFFSFGFSASICTVVA
jgi:hypothetical protein